MGQLNRRLFVDAFPLWMRGVLLALRFWGTSSTGDTYVWIGEDIDGSLWRFPATTDGWSKRVPYRGRRSWLREVPSTSVVDPGFRRTDAATS